MSLEPVTLFAVSEEIIEDTEVTLSRAGDDGYEVFVLWSGTVVEETFKVGTAHVPKQTSYQTDDGLLVRVGADALHALNVSLYERHEILGVQVHAHPHGAYHSVTDDTYPIVTVLGGLSLVAPDFGRRGLLCADAAAYRLGPSGWVGVDARSVLHVHA